VIRLFENKMPKFVHTVATNTLFNKERMINLGVQKEKIHYIPNGVDKERFTIIEKQTTKDIINAMDFSNHKIIAFIGSLNLENHPVDLVIKAFSEIKTFLPNTKLLIVGGGKDINMLKSFADDIGLNDEIVFTGRVSSDLVPYYYKIADVSVDPVYDTEEAKGRCPLKMFESWAMNIPFITADVGDRSVLVGEYSSNILAIPGDHHDLAKKIIAVLTDDELATKLGDFFNAKVEEYYWDRIVADNLDIFF
jgi:glycosyltransferase involved in cell wall biosynthesis